MRLGWDRPAAVVLLDPEQALDTWQRLGITFDLFTTTHGESHRSRGWLIALAGALAGAGTVLVGVYKINASNAMPKPYLHCNCVHIIIYIHMYARAHARTCTRSIANSTCNRTQMQKQTQTQTHANANKRIVAFDAWAISACKRDCVLRSTCNRTQMQKQTQTQTHANANKRIVAFDAWAISACKRDCVLRVRSKTFRMYYRSYVL